MLHALSHITQTQHSGALNEASTLSSPDGPVEERTIGIGAYTK